MGKASVWGRLSLQPRLMAGEGRDRPSVESHRQGGRLRPRARAGPSPRGAPALCVAGLEVGLKCGWPWAQAGDGGSDLGQECGWETAGPGPVSTFSCSQLVKSRQASHKASFKTGHAVMGYPADFLYLMGPSVSQSPQGTSSHPQRHRGPLMWLSKEPGRTWMRTPQRSFTNAPLPALASPL